MSPFRLRLSAVVVATVAAVTTFAPLAGPASAVVPQAHATLPAAIEVMPPYQPQTFCDPVAKPGVAAFAKVLTSTYAHTSIVSLTRPCGSDTSEHYDGRAIDWGVDHRNDHQRAQGKAFLHWLFAADSNGDHYAMVRRLGVMYVIWNKRIWGSWDQTWEPYSCSGVTACHVDHMHLSFDWSGAMKKTSFWTGKVTAPMPPPLVGIRVHHPVTLTVSAHDGDPQPTYKLAAGGRYRVVVAGAYHYDSHRHHRADAECSTTDGDAWTVRPAVDGEGSLDLSVNGHHGWHPVGAGSDGCSDGHTYRHVLAVTHRAPLAFHLDDTVPWEPTGDLTVTVTRLA